MTKPEAYKLGFDCGLNGSNQTNSNFSIFQNAENTKQWEQGKIDGEKLKLQDNKHLKHKIQQCTELAKIQVPWANVIYNYCPFHANELIILSNEIGATLTPVKLHISHFTRCESFSEIDEIGKQLNKKFQ